MQAEIDSLSFVLFNSNILSLNQVSDPDCLDKCGSLNYPESQCLLVLQLLYAKLLFLVLSQFIARLHSDNEQLQTGQILTLCLQRSTNANIAFWFANQSQKQTYRICFKSSYHICDIFSNFPSSWVSGTLETSLLDVRQCANIACLFFEFHCPWCVHDQIFMI